MTVSNDIGVKRSESQSILLCIVVYTDLRFFAISSDAIKWSFKNGSSMEPFECPPGSIPVIIYFKKLTNKYIKNYKFSTRVGTVVD